MEILFTILCCVPALLFIVICCSIIDNNKNEDGYNEYNSSLGVQCGAKEKCDFRFSSSCNACKHNCGMKQIKSSYESR